MNALKDPEYWRLVRNNLADAGRGIVRGVATDLPGSAVDLVNMAYLPAMNALGYSLNPEDTVGSSAWFAKQGDQRGLLPTGDSIPFKAGQIFGPMLTAAVPDSVELLAKTGGKVANALAEQATRPQMINQAGAIAYHGSPHKFDRFDMSKIGTGEGAQAYGHGLYFAENPDVAKMYKPDRAYVGRVMAGKPAEESFGPEWYAQNTLDETGSAESAVDRINGWLKSVSFSKAKGMDQERDNAKKAIELIKSGTIAPRGSLYEVDIPDEAIANMLDWDAPLSEQPEAVRDAINRVAREPEAYGLDKVRDDMRGIELKKLLNDPRAVKRLNELGIPGIKYYDGVSRGKGQGTRNYVVFDDQLPKILKSE